MQQQLQNVQLPVLHSYVSYIQGTSIFADNLSFRSLFKCVFIPLLPNDTFITSSLAVLIPMDCVESTIGSAGFGCICPGEFVDCDFLFKCHFHGVLVDFTVYLWILLNIDKG